MAVLMLKSPDITVPCGSPRDLDEPLDASISESSGADIVVPRVSSPRAAEARLPSVARDVGSLRVLDLAREATVYRALAGSPDIPPATREALTAAAAQLGLFAGVPSDLLVDDLVRGHSSAAYSGNHASAHSTLGVGLSGQMRQEVERLIAGVAARMHGSLLSDTARAAAVVIASHWGISSAQDLWPGLCDGTESTELDALLTSQNTGDRSRVVAAAALTRIGTDNKDAVLVPSTDPCRALSLVPLLRDAAEWVCWDSTYRSTYGNLGSFLTGPGSKACTSLNLRFVEGPRGVFVRVAGSGESGPDAAVRAIRSRDVVTAAAALAAYAVFDAPDSRSISETAPSLAAAAAEAGVAERDEGCVSDGAARLILGVIAALPPSLRGVLGGVALVPALLTLDGGTLSLAGIVDLALKGAPELRPALLAALAEWPGGNAEAAIETLLVPPVSDPTGRGVSQRNALVSSTDASLALTSPTASPALSTVDDSASPSAQADHPDDDAALALPPTPADARALVEDIRRNWIESESGSGLAHRVAVSATGRLAGELYADAAHFLYEILQNADDNAYAPGVEPTIEFVLGSPKGNLREAAELAVTINEKGFRRCDVVAICQTGGSTKTSAGFIGKKGLGWKSVFAVTARPEVHSGNMCVWILVPPSL